MLSEITPLILTFNEAPNIGRTLAQLAWAKDIVVVDSFSTDSTLDIARACPAVRVVQRRFDTFAGQLNFGNDQVTSRWILALDADYVLSNELIAELQALDGRTDAAGYSVRFKYCIGGRPLRGSLYPPRVVLYRKDRAHYREDGHAQQLQIDGCVSALQAAIYHDDRKSFDRWLSDQNRYMITESRHLAGMPIRQLNLADQLRRTIVLAPLVVFVYTLFGKGLILNGWRGWFYTAQRTVAELILSIRLAERKFSDESDG